MEKGCIAYGVTAQKLADYLDVSVEYLLSDENDLQNHPLSERESELLRVFSTLDEIDQIRVLSQVQVLALLSQGEFSDTLQMLRQLRDKGLSVSEILKMVDETEKKNGMAEST